MRSLVAVFEAAVRHQVLHNIESMRAPYRASLFPDDVVIFLNPSATELHATMRLLEMFADSIGLKANWAKSVGTPIHCNPDTVTAATVELACPVKEFPITYLGMPLSDRRLRRTDQRRGCCVGREITSFCLTALSLCAPPSRYGGVSANAACTSRLAGHKIRRDFLWNFEDKHQVPSVSSAGLTCASRRCMEGSGSPTLFAKVDHFASTRSGSLGTIPPSLGRGTSYHRATMSMPSSGPPSLVVIGDGRHVFFWDSH